MHMERKWIFFAILVVLALAASSMGNDCFYVGLGADGRVLGPYAINSSSYDITLAWMVEPNRSYVVEATTHQGSPTGGALSPDVNIDHHWCPTTDISSGVTITNSYSESPGIPAGGVRRSVVSTTFSGYLEMRIHNMDANTSWVDVTVTETTLYSPTWSTFTPFLTQWAIMNTSNATITATLTVTDSIAGGPYTKTFTVQAGKAYFVTSNSTFSGGPIPINHNGGAILVHDGPPGAVSANAYILKSDGSVAIPVEFKPARENKH